MRRNMTALLLSTLFIAAPALARTQHRAVASQGEVKPEAKSEAKPEVKGVTDESTKAEKTPSTRKTHTRTKKKMGDSKPATDPTPAQENGKSQ